MSRVPFEAPRQAPLAHLSPARELGALEDVARTLRSQPILDLGHAFAALGCLAPAQVDLLRSEDSALLRSRSHELVDRGLVTDEQWHHAMALVAGVVAVELAGFDASPTAFAELPLAQAKDLEVVPLGMANEQFVVAAWNPTSVDLRRRLVSLTGHTVWLVWANRKEIAHRLERQTLKERGQGAIVFTPASAPRDGRTVLTVDDLVMQAMSEVDTSGDAEQSGSGAESAGMVRLVNEMIAEARRLQASDIHIETNPGESLTLIRFRRDGDLEPYLRLPSRLRGPLVSRIKIMARLDIAERRRPQDGKIDFSQFGGVPLELRVAVLPTHDGLEDVVLRLLESAKPLPLASLGLQPRDLELISSFSSRTFGLVLAAGPTGSGKTTTLHSLLAQINTAERKIWTAEDPIEITQPGLRQVQMNEKIGLNFATAMRSFLRADPDVIMIGEVRDAETAKIAIEASLTGHLVLSTLHTNNACESVVRLLDLGMDPMNFGDSLLGIVAQRLVRSLCPVCAQHRRLSESEWETLLDEYREGSRLTREQALQRLLAAAGVESPDGVQVGHAVGCEHCKSKGYKGRTGVYEILQNHREIRSLIQDRARPNVIFDMAVSLGMRSLRHDALEKVVQGRIDLKQARTAYL